MKREYISYSALKAFAKSPNHYLQYVSGQQEQTAAMAFGIALHCFVLEPQKFDERFAIASKWDRRTKEGKAAYEQFEAQAAGKTVISAADMEAIQAMTQALARNAAAMELLQDCEYEQAVRATLQRTPFHGIVDAWRRGAFALDLKTCQDASPEAFQRAATNMLYHEQAALYRMATGENRFYWIAMETSAPHNVAVYQQSDAAYEKARRRVLSLLSQFEEWDGQPGNYFEGIKTLDLPAWA